MTGNHTTHTYTYVRASTKTTRLSPSSRFPYPSHVYVRYFSYTTARAHTYSCPHTYNTVPCVHFPIARRRFVYRAYIYSVSTAVAHIYFVDTPLPNAFWFIIRFYLYRTCNNLGKIISLHARLRVYRIIIIIIVAMFIICKHPTRNYANIHVFVVALRSVLHT